MVTINKIKEEPIQLWHKGHLVGRVENILEFNDIRIQIKERKLEGYYFVLEEDEMEYHVDTNGGMSPFPPCFRLIEKQLDKLIVWD